MDQSSISSYHNIESSSQSKADARISVPDDRRKTDSSEGSSREIQVASKGESSTYRTNYSSKETFAKNQEGLSSLES